MYLNQYSVRVYPGEETTDGYVEMNHGMQYTLHLRNNHREACDAQVFVDGKDVGTFRISALGAIQLERPGNDQGRFTFYQADSVEAQQSGVQAISISERGLIKVVFTPEKIKPVVYQPWPGEPGWQQNQPLNTVNYRGSSATQTSSLSYGSATAACAAPCYSSVNSAGMTGLSGYSNQTFYTVASLDYDYARQVVIHLRLVSRKQSTTPRPLVSMNNPVPPPVF